MFFALIQGTGEGCDYTIECNQKFQPLKSESYETAVEECKNLLDYYGDERIESIQLIEVVQTTKLPVDGWKTERSDAKYAEAKKLKVAKLEEELKKLKGNL